MPSWTRAVRRTMSVKEQEAGLTRMGYTLLRLYPDELERGDYILSDGRWTPVAHWQLYRKGEPGNVFPDTTHVEVTLQQGCYVSCAPGRKIPVWRKA